MELLPKKTGVLIGGFNPVVVDYTAALLMGFNWKKIPQIVQGFKNEFYNLSPEPQKIDKKFLSGINKYKFIPPSGWKDL